MDHIERVLTYWRIRVTEDATYRQIGPVEAAVINASMMLEEILPPAAFEEETITAALLGSLASSLPWVAPVVGTTRPEDTLISWGHYRKAASHDMAVVTESVHGADFALALRVGDDHVKVAIFQAKRPVKGQGQSIHILKATTVKEGRYAQFDALVESACTVMRHRPEFASARFDSLDWVHYLAYLPTGSVTLPMNALTSFYDQSIQRGETGPTSLLVTKGLPLMDLLRQAVVLPPDDHRGWLVLTVDQANLALPHLRSLMPIYVADESRGGARLTPDVSIDMAVAKPSARPGAAPNTASGAAPPPPPRPRP